LITDDPEFDIIQHMIKPIVLSGDKVLRTESKKVAKIDKKIGELIKDLKDTLVAQKEPEGVGLAAPQIGKNFRVFVMWPNPSDKIKVVINPTPINVSKKPAKEAGAAKTGSQKKIMEGCLSLPNYYSPLTRASTIRIKYRNENWDETEETFYGIDAQIVEHEIDHLNGILFLDRMLEQKKRLYEYKNGEWDEIDI